MKFATTFIAAATASGMGSANDASALNCGSDAQIASCWEAYATFIPAANQTAGGDITGPYGTEWDLQTSSGACGITIAEATSMVNQTCEVSWTAGGLANVGGTAFAAGKNAQGVNLVAGLDFSGTVAGTFTWDVEISDLSAWAATKDANITDTSIDDCFVSAQNRQASIKNCVDSNTDGSAETKPMIMFSNNEAGSANNEFAIANAGKSVTVEMNVPCTTVSSDMGDVTFDAIANGNTCLFVIDVTDSAPALLVFKADTQEQVDFFKVTVA
jgi:hypothetical protein